MICWLCEHEHSDVCAERVELRPGIFGRCNCRAGAGWEPGPSKYSKRTRRAVFALRACMA
jgi:hypothetical protein